MERTLAALTLALRHIWASLLFSFLSGLVPRDGFFKKKKKHMLYAWWHVLAWFTE